MSDLLTGFIVFICSSASLLAQEIITTDGNFSSNAQGSLSWTLGEPVTETFSDGNNLLTQGFQQNYESLLSVDGPENLPSLELFPNPFSEDLTLQYSGSDASILIEIYDAQSRRVLSKNYPLNGSMISVTLELSELSTGHYQVRIARENQPAIVRPIIKFN